MIAKLEIRGDGIQSKIFLDGQEVDGVHGLTLNMEAGEVPQVILKMRTVNVGASLDNAWVTYHKSRWATLRHFVRCIRLKRTFALK